MKKVTWTGYRCRSCSGSGSKPGNISFTVCAFCHSPDIERNDSNSNKRLWKSVDHDKCELEGPYECPWCSGHVMLDATFLDQVDLEVKCPYCGSPVCVKEIE